MDCGKKVVLHGLAHHFLARSSTQVDYVLLDEADPSHPPESRIIFHRLSLAAHRTRLLTALIRSIVRRRPLQQTLLYSDALQRAIREKIAAIEPDLVIYDTIRVSQLIDNPRALLPRARHVLYLDDLFSVRYAATLQAMDRYPHARLQPLGNFAKHLPEICHPLLKARWLCRYLLRREMRLVQRVEATEVARFDVSLLVNRAEVKLLQERSGRDTVAVLPIPLSRSNQPVAARHYQGSPEFVFIGALNVAHNQCSLEYFLTNIFDDCVRSIPGIKLRVIGQDPSDELLALFARYPKNIKWIAWVAELGDIFAQSCAMLVPLLFGSGVKLKTLEALHYTLPVLSTQFGIEGIVSDPAEPSGIIVEDDLRRFPALMRSLLDPQQNNRLSAQARTYYAANYGAEASARQYEALFGA